MNELGWCVIIIGVVQVVLAIVIYRVAKWVGNLQWFIQEILRTLPDHITELIYQKKENQ